MISEHGLITIFIILLIISHLARTWQSREQIKNVKMIQAANLSMLAPLQNQSLKNASDIRDCHSRIEKLEDSLARWTAGWDMVELDARRKKHLLPWTPRERDKFYAGRGRAEYL